MVAVGDNWASRIDGRAIGQPVVNQHPRLKGGLIENVGGRRDSRGGQLNNASSFPWPAEEGIVVVHMGWEARYPRSKWNPCN